MDAQFKKGILDLCVLSILDKKEVYGYGLKLEVSSVLDVNENTLYPLLRRLEKDGYLETFAKVSDQQRVRKYYRMTPQGKAHLHKMKEEWHAFLEAASRLIDGEEDE